MPVHPLLFCCCDKGDTQTDCGCDSAVTVTWSGSFNVGYDCDESCFDEVFGPEMSASVEFDLSEVVIICTSSATDILGYLVSDAPTTCAYEGETVYTLPLKDCNGTETGDSVTLTVRAAIARFEPGSGGVKWFVQLDFTILCNGIVGLGTYRWIYTADSSYDCPNEAPFAWDGGYAQSDEEPTPVSRPWCVPIGAVDGTIPEIDIGMFGASAGSVTVS